LKFQNKWLILDNPKGLANINIWASEATWHCVNFRKFTWSCLCESPSNPGPMLAFHFMDLKTSWPSKWGILLVKEDLLVYFVMALAICDRSPN
jgi:hypothetical protein